MIKITTWALLASSGLVFFTLCSMSFNSFSRLFQDKWQKKFLFFSHTLIRKEWEKVGP